MASSSGTGTMTPITGGGIGLGDIGPGLPPTLLPLARYAQIMGISSPHFHQMAGPKALLAAGCDDVWDQPAREELAWTIQQAEQMIANELGFWPAPRFITAERVPFGIMGVRSDWRNAEVKTGFGLVECYGTELLTLVQADAVVQYTDSDSDPLGREELATIGTALYQDLAACDAACEVAIFFRVADGAIDSADPRFEIRPFSVDIDGSTMHITAEASQFITPTLWNLTEADCWGSDDPNLWRWNYDVSRLVAQVDVYCRTVYQATPVTLRWDGICDCPGVCQHETQLACAYPTDNRRGFFVPRPATWNGTTNVEATPSHSSPPESVEVNYRAGYPVNSRYCRMDAKLERAIVKLTNALLPEPPCGYCDAARQKWEKDRMDVDPLTPESASMPWDIYTRGALESWRIVKRLALGRGGGIGRGYR